MRLSPGGEMLSGPSGSSGREEDWMAFLFRLETVEGTPADPPTHATAVPNWRPGDTIPLGGRTLRVVGVRDNDADEPPALVVEDVAG
jgi:hypothetical protein